LKLINVLEAKEILNQDGIVAIPTETVYGLGAWIYSEYGLKNIFSTKERPFFDPLIVHVDTILKAKALTSEWTEIHEILATECWPGPLTMIAKKNKLIHPLITSGLDSVGLRCPRHALTLKLLSLIEGGVAAPSANKFGKTSPTSSLHVYQEFGDKVPILEGGSSEIGIESTVIGIQKGKLEIFRPGFFTARMLRDILKKYGISIEVKYAESPVAPGQLKHHYMPKIPLIIVPENFNLNLVRNDLGISFKNPVLWKQPQSPEIASRELYHMMRKFDEKGYDIIFAEKGSHHLTEDWLGIWNRLEKAKTLSLCDSLHNQ
jgi:L-threonylcarbamoyladenylate synthase